MKHLLPILFLLCAATLFATNYLSEAEYYQKKAEGYRREAEYFQKKAQGYEREAEYYIKKAEGYQREAAYYSKKGDIDRANTQTRYARNAMDNAKTQQRYASVNAEADALWKQIRTDVCSKPIDDDNFLQIQAKRQIWQRAQKFLNKYPALSPDYPYIHDQIQTMLREIWINVNNFNKINNPFE